MRSKIRFKPAFKLHIKTFLLFHILVTSSLFHIGWAQTTETFSTPGTYSWTVPACVTSVTVQVWGGGGGGGGSISIMRSSNDSEACSGAGGGGGGGFSERTFPVIPGQTYTVTVGDGGIGGASGNGTSGSGITTPPSAGGNGGASSFIGHTFNIAATGGIGGNPAGAYNNNNNNDVNAFGTGGAGGVGSGGILNFNGGNGAAGLLFNFSTDKSGGGGGAAGPGGNGGNAPLANSYGIIDNFPGGTGNAPGGNGGSARMHNQPSNAEKIGGNGGIIGGGGGGGLTHKEGFGVVRAVGGNGARGEVRITYTAGTPIDPIFTAVSPICSGDPLPALPSTSTNGISGTWSPPINNTTTTLYTFTPNPSPCANQTTMSIVVDAQPSGKVTANSTVCAGGNILIDGTAITGNSNLEYQFDGTTGTWNSLGTDSFNWTNAGPSHATVYVRAVIQNGVCPELTTSPIEIYVDPCGLPIELTSFTGSCAGRTKTFDWTTASETNNDYFSLERSTDGETFETVKIIPGAGTSTSSHHYSVQIAEADANLVYYRLKQTDYDGQYSYSNIIHVSCTSDNGYADELTVYPNPANESIQIQLHSNEQGTYMIAIYNLLGQVVQEVQHTKSGAETLSVPLTVASGQYVLRVTELNSGKTFNPVKIQVITK